MDSGAFAARQRDLGSSVHEILLDRGHVRIGVVASCAIAWYAVPSTTSSAKLLIAIAPTFFFRIVFPPDNGPSPIHSYQRTCLPSGPPSVKRAHLDRRPAGNDSLAPPRQCLLHVGGFQHPKTAYVLLGLQVRPVGDEHLAIGLRPQRPRIAGHGEA